MNMKMAAKADRHRDVAALVVWHGDEERHHLGVAKRCSFLAPSLAPSPPCAIKKSASSAWRQILADGGESGSRGGWRERIPLWNSGARRHQRIAHRHASAIMRSKRGVALSSSLRLSAMAKMAKRKASLACSGGYLKTSPLCRLRCFALQRAVGSSGSASHLAKPALFARGSAGRRQHAAWRQHQRICSSPRLSLRSWRNGGSSRRRGRAAAWPVIEEGGISATCDGGNLRNTEWRQHSSCKRLPLHLSAGVCYFRSLYRSAILASATMA